MNEQNELKLGMTPEEVAKILGKPDKIEKTGWQEVNCYYTTDYENIIVRFVDNQVKHIRQWSKNLDWDGETRNIATISITKEQAAQGVKVRIPQTFIKEDAIVSLPAPIADGQTFKFEELDLLLIVSIKDNNE
jgi:outer membrane protein assembly factor BamE (lipoprotein component of BamABCDE complex)